MTTLTLSRDNARGAYLLTGADGTVLGSLAADRRLRHGEAVIAAGGIAVHSGGLRRRSACAGDEQAPVLRLDTSAAVVPGLPGAQWDVSRDRSRFTGTLSGAGARIVVTVPAGGNGPLQAEVEGDFPGWDLAVLTAAFALLARRHADTMFTAALVSVATGGAGR
ncbi:hypothetical protein ACFO1B_40495 [Dactylosporangium siamense]|uniref:Uncharacterized protein n=1 Tax=Dactylosporangium siamense TaxID=685454 RepID=A0A919PXH6_9ACTN|nr:hypothetical protein [Dactylosporangium siamense]GIG52590.1 hypothetical protein Dsi01nite_106310 [Dactylosporangium siamense]